ncbi:MAG: hypothetical protein FGM33_08310 [Candidatus Kapabacteria bacterium]|nr:hypothetical protein [Candidatus Kapabacteria bacterium]
MSQQRHQQQQDKKTPVVPIVMGLVFGAVLIMLVLNGGMCERYERKMERQRQMRDYLESQRRR